MKKKLIEDNLEARANLFKALGHPVRLLLLNLINQKARHGQELAEILNMNAATVSHHLTKLADAGLVESKKDQYYQVYSLTGNMLTRTLEEVIQMPQPELNELVEEDAYRYKVLKTFMRHGRITRIPKQHKKLRVLLDKLIEEFEPNREYGELEVNRILVEFNEDVAFLRRAMVEEKYFDRTRSTYVRKVAES